MNSRPFTSFSLRRGPSRPRRRHTTALRRTAVVIALAILPSCFDRSVRWEVEDVNPPPPPEPVCAAGQMRCTSAIERCDATAAGPAWTTVEDCAAQGLVCAPTLFQCKVCVPDQQGCDKFKVTRCRADGSGTDFTDTCEPDIGEACRAGGCVQLCNQATIERSNVGCEYWAVDLDNAMIDPTSNASAQQFAVVISNAQPDVPVEVSIEQDDGAPGDAPAPYQIAGTVIAPLNLQVFKLGPREVDGSPEGQFNTGTHTALTRHAYRIKTNFPVVAYQFNPLENANVFSNDASLLKPLEALAYPGEGLKKAYVVAGWPQTIAHTDNPDTNFNPNNPIHLRAFLTIVGTGENTTVRVTTKAAVVGGGPIPATPVNGTVEATLHAFDVLNLETGDFNADFTGSIIEADGPIAVFTGSEASDAPRFNKLAERRCCADHLEDQLDPVRATGKRFAITHSPSRTRAVNEAGATTTVVPEPEYIRFVAARNGGAVITTTLPPPNDTIVLADAGDYHEVTVYSDFMAESTAAVVVSQVMASQDAAFVKRGLPGGDPSIVIVPPIEQFRADYVFLTPDKYAFDFVSVIAPPGVVVLLDELPLGPERCLITPADGLTPAQRGTPDPPLLVYTCQLSFPTINPLVDPPLTLPGTQNDGVHRIVAGVPIGVMVTGFDNYVSYAYAGGTDLRELGVPE
jgi:hypothetical protein